MTTIEANTGVTAAVALPQLPRPQPTSSIPSSPPVDDDERCEVKSNLRFPWKLHQLLTETEKNGNASIVSWLPRGKSFKVYNKVKFAAEIMPVYFNSTKYKSFQRSLNVWGFESVSQGAEKGAVYHPYFVRDQPELCRNINRQSSNGPNGKDATLGLRAHHSSRPPFAKERGHSEAPQEYKDTFPHKLHNVLSVEDYRPYITWMPHGRCFRILNPNKFEQLVAPLHFGITSYSNFVRQLESYGFTRIPHGKDINCYYHEMMIRGLPHLCRYISSPDDAGRFYPPQNMDYDFYKMERHETHNNFGSPIDPVSYGSAPSPTVAEGLQQPRTQIPSIQASSAPSEAVSGTPIEPNGGSSVTATNNISTYENSTATPSSSAITATVTNTTSKSSSPSNPAPPPPPPPHPPIDFAIPNQPPNIQPLNVFNQILLAALGGTGSHPGAAGAGNNQLPPHTAAALAQLAAAAASSVTNPPSFAQRTSPPASAGTTAPVPAPVPANLLQPPSLQDQKQHQQPSSMQPPTLQVEPSPNIPPASQAAASTINTAPLAPTQPPSSLPQMNQPIPLSPAAALAAAYLNQVASLNGGAPPINPALFSLVNGGTPGSSAFTDMVLSSLMKR